MYCRSQFTEKGLNYRCSCLQSMLYVYLQNDHYSVDIGTVEPVEEIKEENSFQGIVFTQTNVALCLR